MPSNVAPRVRMAALERALTPSVWILTRPKPHVSKACSSSSSLDSGLTRVPHQREPYIVQPRCTCSRSVSTSPSELVPTTVPARPSSPSATRRIVYAVRPASRAARTRLAPAGAGVRVRRAPGPVARSRGGPGRLRVGQRLVPPHHDVAVLVAARVGVDREEPGRVAGRGRVESDHASDEGRAGRRDTSVGRHGVTVDLMVPAPPWRSLIVLGCQ